MVLQTPSPQPVLPPQFLLSYLTVSWKTFSEPWRSCLGGNLYVTLDRNGNDWYAYFSTPTTIEIANSVFAPQAVSFGGDIGTALAEFRQYLVTQGNVETDTGVNQ